jgi:hypothetical protein
MCDASRRHSAAAGGSSPSAADAVVEEPSQGLQVPVCSSQTLPAGQLVGSAGSQSAKHCATVHPQSTDTSQ